MDFWTRLRLISKVNSCAPRTVASTKGRLKVLKLTISTLSNTILLRFNLRIQERKEKKKEERKRNVHSTLIILDPVQRAQMASPPPTRTATEVHQLLQKIEAKFPTNTLGHDRWYLPTVCTPFFHYRLPHNREPIHQLPQTRPNNPPHYNRFPP